MTGDAGYVGLHKVMTMKGEELVIVKDRVGISMFNSHNWKEVIEF